MLTLGGLLLAGGPCAHAGQEILLHSAGGLWQRYFVFDPMRITVADARAMELDTSPAARAAYLHEMPRGRRRPHYTRELHTPMPPEHWMAADFDDRDWLLMPGADFTGSHVQFDSDGSGWVHFFWREHEADVEDPQSLRRVRVTDRYIPELAASFLRGVFTLQDPAAVTALTLELTYRGGFVAFLNGVEVARGHLPAEPLSATLAGDDYDPVLFGDMKDQGQLERNRRTGRSEAGAQIVEGQHDHMLERERHSGLLELDPALLQAGPNVLALAIFRSDLPASVREREIAFAPVGLAELFLRAGTDDPTAVSGADTTAFHVRPAAAWELVTDGALRSAQRATDVLHITAARQGRFSGQVVVMDEQPLKNLQAQVSDLHGPDGAVIGQNQLKLRYAVVNPVRDATRLNWASGLYERRLDALLDQAPAQIDVTTPSAEPLIRQALGLQATATAQAVTSVWLTVDVPADMAPGVYRGDLRIHTDDQQAMVPVELTVTAWRVPAQSEQNLRLFIYQSPETLADYYNVPLWSAQHWDLVERSLAWMGRMGNGGLMLSLLARTQMGNDDSLVRWVARDDGGWDFDTVLLDRYLDLVFAHHLPEQIHGVVLNLWGEQTDVRRNGRPGIGGQVTTLDRATGETALMTLPAYGTPEAEAMLAPMLAVVIERLEERGLADRVLIGTTPDAAPNPAHVAMFGRLLPAVAWYRVAHVPMQGYDYDLDDPDKRVPVGLTSLIARHGLLPAPSAYRMGLWRDGVWGPNTLIFNRGGSSWILGGFPEPLAYRGWLEASVISGYPGAGHLGADYFEFAQVPEDWPTSYHPTGTYFNRFPTSDIELLPISGSTSDLLAPGPDGPVATVRLENGWEGKQLAMARQLLEVALLDEDHPLPEDLAARCQTLLDERLMALRVRRLNNLSHWGSLFRDHLPLYAINWRGQTHDLFELAAQVEQHRANIAQ